MNQSCRSALLRSLVKGVASAVIFSFVSGLSGPSVGVAQQSTAATPSLSKESYSLWTPVPRAQLRELSTDRPDQTESPYTVDAGHVQLEADVANFTFDRDTSGGADLRTQVWNVAPVNLKLGLTNRADFQLLVDNYVHVRVEDRLTGVVAKTSGFGDVTARLKINFWGNDGRKTAFGVMPLVKLPLSASNLRNGKTEGGVIFPFAMELRAGWGMGAMTEIDFVSDGANGHDTEWLNSITFGHDLTERWGAYVEFVAVTGDAPGFKSQGQFDLGFTYAMAADAQLDFGCNLGVTKSAPDCQLFLGFSQRF